MLVIDTNVILRYLVGDDVEKADRIEKFLRTKTPFLVNDVVAAEVYYVLRSYYKHPRLEIIESLRGFLEQSQVKYNRPLIDKSLDILSEHNIDFADAYTAAIALIESDCRVITFDLDFDKIAGIKRVEP
ncbi:MAG: PIN domain-containing protein [Candidatus Berkelbacteria bacterium]|nr:PIN domain-containing protein [Candidatus Berkelbacteria bacterium]MCR4307856.1 PIN domain-containing protein [Candidatus Berkelbacteria bacterium]